MRSHSKIQMSKFFRIWTFVLLFLTTNILTKPAWAFLSTVDQCLSQPQCAGAIAEELAPVIAAPLPTAGGQVAISATTATGATTSSEAVAGVALIADVRLSGVLAYRVWQIGQNEKAQEKAKQRYCEAYPTDGVCPKVGEPYYIWFHNSAKQPQYLCVLSHTWGPATIGSSPYLMGYVDLVDILNQSYSYSYFTEDVYWGKGVNIPFNGYPPTCSFNPAPAWQDWPQAKRDIAVAALKQPDWQEFIKSMPEGGRLNMGDQLESPVIVLPGLDTDDPNTPIDERLAKKLPGSFTNPGLPGQFDFDDDGTDDDSDPEPQDPNVPTASSNPPPEPSPEPSPDQNGEQETWNAPRGDIPADWGDGEETNSGIGRRWVDPANKKGNGVRIDKGNSNNSQTTQQVDHVVVRKDGKVIGRDGQPIQGSIKNNAINAHIPLQEWLTWSKWYAP